MTNEKRCLLAGSCNYAGDSNKCGNTCGAWVSTHGVSGTGGRAGAANIPADYRLTTLSTSPVQASQTKEYRMLDAYVKTFERAFTGATEPIKSVYIQSETAGNGKTTTACALLNEWIIRHYLLSLKHDRHALQRPGYFLSMNDLQRLFNRAHSPGSQDTKDKAGDEFARKIDIAKESPFLVIDDLGVRKATSAFISQVYDLIDYRTTEVLPTVYTSNLTMDELAELFRDEDPQGKIVSRISDRCVELYFDGPTKRGMKK